MGLDKTGFKIFITLFLIYVYFISWYGWNEESNFILTRAISDENRFEIDSFYNLTGDRSFYNGHYYSDKFPGLSMLSTPVYSFYKYTSRIFSPRSFTGDGGYITSFTNSIPIYTYENPGSFVLNSMFLVTAFTSSLFTALTSILIYKKSKRFTDNNFFRKIVTFGFGLGTISFVYATHFMNHAVGAFFLFLSFYELFKNNILSSNSDRDFNYNFFLSGICFGFSMVADPIIIATLPFFLLYVSMINLKSRTRENLGIFLLALIIGLSPLLVYNYSIFDNPVDLASAYIDRDIYRSAYSQNPFSSVILNSNNNVVESSTLSIIGLLRHFHFLSSFNPYIVIRLLSYPYRGLLFYSPVLMLSFVGLYFMLKKYRLEAVIISAIFLSFLVVLSMRSHWWGGYCFGNRYIVPVIPFLMVPIMFLSEKVNPKKIIALVSLLTAISIFVNLMGMQVAENYAYDWGIMHMRQSWIDKQDSFDVLYNPLLRHYWPKFLENGPRSLLLNSIVNGYSSIDIRSPQLLKGTSDVPYDIGFLSLMPVAVLIVLIWCRELKDWCTTVSNVLRKS